MGGGDSPYLVLDNEVEPFDSIPFTMLARNRDNPEEVVTEGPKTLAPVQTEQGSQEECRYEAGGSSVNNRALTRYRAGSNDGNYEYKWYPRGSNEIVIKKRGESIKIVIVSG